MPSKQLLKQIEMELGEARSEISVLERVQGILASNGAGPETQPAGPRKPGGRAPAARRRTTAARGRTTTGRGRRPGAKPRKRAGTRTRAARA